nr:hypothetical protein [Compostimonas suwonensis]
MVQPSEQLSFAVDALLRARDELIDETGGAASASSSARRRSRSDIPSDRRLSTWNRRWMSAAEYSRYPPVVRPVGETSPRES